MKACINIFVKHFGVSLQYMQKFKLIIIIHILNFYPQ
jgi:hypothetical protein